MQREPGEQQEKKSGNQPRTTAGGGASAASAAKPTLSKDQQTTASQSNAGDDLLQHAKDTTGKVVDQVQQQATSRIDRQKENAATDLQKVADAVRQMGDGLKTQDQGPISQYAADYGRKAAENIERLTNYLRANDTKKLVRDVE